MTDSAGSRNALGQKQALRAVGFRLIPFFGYLGLIFYAGGAPSSDGPSWQLPGADKTLHAIGFGLLYFLAVPVVTLLRPNATIAFTVVAAILVSSTSGAALELYQATLVHRSAELLDWVADTVGAMLAAVSSMALSRAWRRWS